MTMLALPALALCTLPDCRGLVEGDGDACEACKRTFGPYLVRQGEPSPWAPVTVPACGHGWWWFRDGGCGHLERLYGPRCGNTVLIPNPALEV